MDISGPGVPPDDQLNARQYYSIGEVAIMFGVKSSLLRYWESEFDVLKLRKNRKGDRFFRPDDIRSLQLIHHLLRDKKYTIEGAREYMRNAGKMKEKFETIEALQRIRQFLVEMRNGLQTDRIPEAH
jgi:DNA-binding transcriptional MerR regulator